MLNIKAMELRNKVDDMRDLVWDLYDAIQAGIDEYIEAEKKAEAQGEDFTEDYFKDYIGWIQDFETLQGEIEKLGLLK